MADIKIQKWGNSLALRLPMTLAKDASLAEGSLVTLRLAKGQIVVEKATAVRLNDLLDQITLENQHGEISTGSRMGKETW
jgi:antitoxin MazE